jgi:hypothetical protein
MTNFKSLQDIFLPAIIIMIIFYFVVNNIRQIKQNNRFLAIGCKKGMCYDNFDKCFSVNGHVYSDSSSDKKIERKTLKCILNTEDKYKLTKLDNIFVPSMMNGTYCDILYTTYYDYNDFTVLKNRFYSLNMPLTKCIRIRHYHFQPGIYFEVKYNGGTKIRALIDENFNVLEEDKLDEEYKDTIISILDKIKSKKVNPIFQNTYKRMSFIYKNDPSIRMTIDSNIEFFHNNIYNAMDKDILEFKIPYSVSIDLANQYLQEINSLAGTNLVYAPFSKFEYYYYKVVMGQN